MQSLLNKTTLNQERAAYTLVKSLCQGDVLESKHPLLKDDIKGVEVYGLWKYMLDKLAGPMYNRGKLTGEYWGDEHREKRIKRVRHALSIMCICGAEMVDLINRYAANAQEIVEIFGLKAPLDVAEPYQTSALTTNEKRVA